MLFKRRNPKSNSSICCLLGVCFGFVGIAIGAVFACHGVIQGHIYIEDHAIAYIDSYKSLGIYMGLMSALIGLISALLGIVVHKLKYLSV